MCEEALEPPAPVKVSFILFTRACTAPVFCLWQPCRLNALVDAAAAAMQLGLAVTRHMSAEVEEHMRNPGTSPYSAFEMQVRLQPTHHFFWGFACYLGGLQMLLFARDMRMAKIPAVAHRLRSTHSVVHSSVQAGGIVCSTEQTAPAGCTIACTGVP